jgi:hypothetical protein
MHRRGSPVGGKQGKWRIVDHEQAGVAFRGSADTIPLMHPAWICCTLPISGLLVLLLLCAGCEAPRPAPAPVEAPILMPDEAVQGRVVSVNPPLRYVVIDFPVRNFPVLDQRLSVYRDGQKIGEVRVTGPILGTAAAGDILAGQAAVGDEVRED